MIRVLSMDGGGIKGVGSAQMLCVLEDKLREKNPEKGVADTFDLFVGTSTGCIIAAGLTMYGHVDADLSPAGLKRLYEMRGREMFTPKLLGAQPFDWSHAKYQSDPKRRIIQEEIGKTTLGELPRNFMGTTYNIGVRPGPYFMHGGPRYRLKSDVHNEDYPDLLLSQVVDASSNAPTYFEPNHIRAAGLDGRGVDGGVFANNPAMCAYVEAYDLWPEDRDILVASFGCGRSALQYPHNQTWGVLEWASPGQGVPLMEVMFNGQAETVTHQLQRLLGPERFFRFDFNLDGEGQIRMDDTRKANVDLIVQAADEELAGPECSARMDALVSQLQLERPPAT